MKSIIVNTFKEIRKATSNYFYMQCFQQDTLYMHAEEHLLSIDYKTSSNICQVPTSIVMMVPGKVPLSEISRAKMKLDFTLRLMYF